MTDAKGAARVSRPGRRRVYKTAGVTAEPEGFAVRLDGRVLRTPRGAAMVVPSSGLARGIAGEWAAAGEVIDPLSMPLTRLANTAIDGIAPVRDAVLDELCGFGRADLLCYRAEYPDSLAAEQARLWQPPLDWAERRFGVRLRVTAGVMAVEQPDDSLAAIRTAFARYDDFRLTAAHSLAGAFGSVVLALAVMEAELDARRAYDLSRLDETHQARTWGRDAQAERRASSIADEVAAALSFAELALGAAP